MRSRAVQRSGHQIIPTSNEGLSNQRQQSIQATIEPLPGPQESPNHQSNPFNAEVSGTSDAFQTSDTFAGSAAGPSDPKRIRRDRGPNWLPQEVIVLIQAKRDQHYEEKATVDKRDLMMTESNKWKRISNSVMSSGYSRCMRDGPACKTKWNQMLPEYKRVADYLACTGQNSLNYWKMSPAQRKQDGLLVNFPEDFFSAIHDWFGRCSQIQPAHSRDTIVPGDSNFMPVDVGTSCLLPQQQVSANEQVVQEGRDLHAGRARPASTESESSPLCDQRDGSEPRPRLFVPTSSDSSLPRPSTRFPPPSSPVIISSSNTANTSRPSQPGNTAVKRKNVLGYTLVAEATKSAGALLGSQMKEIADAALEVEKSKMDVQERLFSVRMDYEKQRDQNVHETTLVTHDDARLSILKQQEMVSALTMLTQVVGQAMLSEINQSAGKEPRRSAGNDSGDNGLAGSALGKNNELHNETTAQ